MKAFAAARLCLAFAILAWFAQLSMPVAHAAAIGAQQAAHNLGCGDAAAQQAALAALPAELRAALDEGRVDVERLASCTLLCAPGSALRPAARIAPAGSLHVAELEPAAGDHCSPHSRPQSPTPPAHAPPPFALGHQGHFVLFSSATRARQAEIESQLDLDKATGSQGATGGPLERRHGLGRRSWTGDGTTSTLTAIIGL